MKPRDFQTLASKLASETGAAELRSAVSRAYYAVYNSAVEMVDKLGFHVSSGAQGHGDVQKWLGNSGDSEIEKVGSKLANLRSRRNRADYELNRRDIEKPGNVQAAVRDAESMLRSLEQCLRESERCQRIKLGIEEYQRKIRPS